ncbi:myosin-1 isoform X2, partial [Tanacetum coccineum]
MRMRARVDSSKMLSRVPTYLIFGSTTLPGSTKKDSHRFEWFLHLDYASFIGDTMCTWCPDQFFDDQHSPFSTNSMNFRSDSTILFSCSHLVISLEQFCINHANERLQQHLNRHLFKLEQEAKVDFEDNQDCLSLFKKKPIELLALMDEEYTSGNVTDMSFADKPKQHLKSNRCFKGERGKAFTVHHYAGE